MNILLTAINAKYIHSNPAVYSLRAYACRYGGSRYEEEIRIAGKRFDFGIGLGIGFEILQSWNIGMNYDLGFVPVVDGGGKHRALLLSVGYKF